jgi:hypothetical protein
MVEDDRGHAWLPPERAFVVQLYADAVLDTAHIAGRVEHIVSGQVGHFHSLATLLSFITSMLVEKDGG